MADIIDMAKKFDRIIEQVDSGFAKYREVLDRIGQMEDPEEQGYHAAPVLMQIAGCDSETLLRSIFQPVPGRHYAEHVARDIGVVRWCLDQRKGHGGLNA